MLACKLPRLYLAIHKLLNEKLAELPPILDSFITGYANTTSTLVGVGGGGEPRSGGFILHVK